MDSPRQHLRSQQSRRRVRFGNNNLYEKNNANIKNNILEKGLDVNLFEGKVDQELICAICNRVFVQPEVSSCQHVFCSSCLNDQVGNDCPTCCIPLERIPSNQPPVHLRLKLLDLVIRCENKCGEVLPLGKLPRHVSDDCPNTPVACPNSKKSGTGGCAIKVKRCQLLDHIKECDWRPVECEACGERTVFKDLVLHQKKSRCVENRIRNQLVHAIKSTQLDALRHKKNLDHQRVKFESNQRRNELDHVRRLQSMKSHKHQGSRRSYSHHHHHQHTFNNDSSLFSSSFNNYSNNSSKNSSYSDNYCQGDNNSESKQERQTISLSLNSKLQPIEKFTDQNNRGNITTRSNGTNGKPDGQWTKDKDTFGHGHVTSITHNDTQSVDIQSNVNVFFTSTDAIDGDSENEKGNGQYSFPPSREIHHSQFQDLQFICKKCNKRARESINKATSCRWHAGPIIELFGGTCYTCGRLDYQHGCMIGYHEK